jgi:imidazolonepropionase-like amidohydrolase
MKRIRFITLLVLSLAGAVAAGISSRQTSATTPHPVAKSVTTEGKPQSTTPTTAIQDVTLFDGKRVTPHATVVFRNGVVVAAGANVTTPPGAVVIDGRGKTLLPGLIDSHVHLFAGSAERALRFGVTTELDMFTSLATLRPLKAEQAAHSVTDRADVFSAGTLITAPGGHGSEYIRIPTFAPGADAQSFVDARIAEGSDYIKLIDESGAAYGMTWPTLSKSELQALTEAAHRRRKLVVVHISTLAAAREAIDAGADGLAHIFGDTSPDPGFGKFVAAHHAFVVPTLTVVEGAGGNASGASLTTDARLEPYLNAAEIQGLKTAFPKRAGSADDLHHAFEAVRALHDAGVPLLAGTDAPNPGTAHGVSMHRELELLVAAGLSPVEALIAATSAPAEAFHLPGRGGIAAGMNADLLLVAGNPTIDIQATRNIDTIWKRGVALTRTRENIPPPTVTPSIPAADLERGTISDFESGKPAVDFGSGWQISTDSIMGGKSTATMEIVDGGANGTAKSMRVHTVTDPGGMYPWAGVMLHFGPKPMAPVDLSARSGVTLFARGDTGLKVLLFAAGSGRIPHVTTVHAGPDWTPISIAWSDLGVDGKDVQAILFCGPGTGTTDFQIDEVRLK